MTQIALALVGSSAEAYDHPSDCEEPVAGTVVSTDGCFVTVNGTEVATTQTADIHFDSHSHDYTVLEGCHQDESHDIDPDEGSTMITVNGSPAYLTKDRVTTDPESDGDVDIIDSGGNDIVSAQR